MTDVESKLAARYGKRFVAFNKGYRGGAYNEYALELNINGRRASAFAIAAESDTDAYTMLVEMADRAMREPRRKTHAD